MNMARTKTRAFHERLKKAREDKGFSLEDVGYELRKIAPRQWWSSRATIHRLESGIVKEENVDPVLLWLLAKVYDVALEELSPTSAAAMGWLLLGGTEVMPGYVLSDDDGGYHDRFGRSPLGDDSWMTPESSTLTLDIREREDSPKRPSGRTRSSTGRSCATSPIAA